MKRISKIYAVIFALAACFIMALPVSAASESGKASQTATLVTASKKVNISKCKITVAKTAVYTGKALKPKVTVKYGKKTLKSGKHYKLTYSENKKIGTAKIKITGISKGGYTGSKTVSFKIVPKKPAAKIKSSTANTVTLSWKKISGAKSYYVYRYDTSKKKYTKLGTTTKTTYTAKKLSSGKKYTFAVKAYAKKNFLSDYSSKVATYTLPAAVKNLTATADTNSAVLNWSKVSNATGYIVYKYDTSSKKYTKVATTKKLTYTVKSLYDSTDYTYAVAAYVSSATYTGAKTNVEFTTMASAPDKVTGFEAVLKDDNAVLTWDETENATGYTVFLYNESTDEYNEIGSTEECSFTYELEEGPYSFVVAAYLLRDDEASYGENSDISSVAIPFSAVENLRAFSSTAPSVNLIWDAKNGADGYEVYSYNEETKEYTYLLDAESEASANIPNVEAAKTYAYAVRAYFNQNGEKVCGAYSEIAKADTSFGEETTIEAYAYSDTDIILKWTLVKGVTSYNIYKYDEETEKYIFIDNTAFRSYVVKDCEADTIYNFAVTAVKNVDENNYESVMSHSGAVSYTKTAPANLKKTYDIFRSGQFGITYAIPYESGQEIATETYVKNGNFAVIATISVETLTLEAKTIYLKDKNKGYIIVPFGLTGFYSEMKPEDLTGDGMDANSLAYSMAPEINEDIPYTINKKTYNGQEVTCEGFVAKSGRAMFYYFNSSGTLVAIEETSQSEAASITKVTKMSATVDDKVFKLPTTFFGWTKLDI